MSVTTLRQKRGVLECWSTQAMDAASMSLTLAPFSSMSSMSLSVQSSELSLLTTPDLNLRAAQRLGVVMVLW